MLEKITKETILEDILKIPEAEDVLTKYNLPCLFCPLAVEESSYLKIGKIAEIYKIDIKNLLKELKEKLKKINYE